MQARHGRERRIESVAKNPIFIMRGDQPSILIEAKAATVNLSAHTLLSQLQRYFMAAKADFAAFTNGVVWQWYRSSNGYELDPAPFLAHDTRSPSKSERHWLRSVSGPTFDPASVRDQAEDAHTSSVIMDWISEARHRPGDELFRVIIRDRQLGHATARRIEQVRRSFMATFQTFMDNEIGNLLDAAREERILARLCELAQRHDGTAVQFGEDIEVLLDL